MEIVYWHWLAFGSALVVLEIFIPSFTIFWFGLGALIVGLLMVIFPDMGQGAQILIWSVSSLAFTIAWFKYFKPRMLDKTTAGIAREAAIGESGQVIKAPVGEQRGVVRFATPIMGDDEWEFIAEGDVALGDRVFIKEISGNTLIVVKLN
ncbi:MAG: NfeD family protein [bacterium]